MGDPDNGVVCAYHLCYWTQLELLFWIVHQRHKFEKLFPPRFKFISQNILNTSSNSIHLSKTEKQKNSNPIKRWQDLSKILIVWYIGTWSSHKKMMYLFLYNIPYKRKHLVSHKFVFFVISNIWSRYLIVHKLWLSEIASCVACTSME